MMTDGADRIRAVGINFLAVPTTQLQAGKYITPIENRWEQQQRRMTGYRVNEKINKITC